MFFPTSGYIGCWAPIVCCLRLPGLMRLSSFCKHPHSPTHSFYHHHYKLRQELFTSWWAIFRFLAQRHIVPTITKFIFIIIFIVISISIGNGIINNIVTTIDIMIMMMIIRGKARRYIYWMVVVLPPCLCYSVIVLAFLS